MKTIKLGEYNLLTVTKLVDFGLYLDGGDAEEILLPARYVPEGTKVGDELNVFIYLDQEERPVATTEKPFVKVGEFALLEVAWVNEYGAFLKWGLMKDLFCPFREQKRRMQIGEKAHGLRVYRRRKLSHRGLCKDRKAPQQRHFAPSTRTRSGPITMATHRFGV